MSYIKNRGWLRQWRCWGSIPCLSQKGQQGTAGSLAAEYYQQLVLKSKIPACFGKLSTHCFISLHQKFDTGDLNFPYSNPYIIKNVICGSSVASWHWKSRCFDILRSGWSLILKFSLSAITCWLPSSTDSLSAREGYSVGWVLERHLTCSWLFWVVWTLV